MIQITINKKEIQVPETWNELNKKQLIQISALLNEKNAKQIDILYKTLWVLSGIPMKEFLEADDVEIYCALRALAFIENEIDLVKNLVPEIRIRWKKYIGPKDELITSVGDEFFYADTYFVKYKQTGEEAYLNKLIACLYRPKSSAKKDEQDYNGDEREEFNSFKVQEREKYFTRVPMNEKLAIMNFFNGCRNQIVGNNRHVFEEGKGSVINEYGWLKVVSAMAQNNPVEMKKLGRENIHLIMTTLDMIQLDRKELEERLKTTK